MNFLPGEPNSSLQAASFTKWAHHSVLAYCSGNNLIIITNLLSKLQTLYFDSDLCCVDINQSNGLIAVTSGPILYIYKPEVSKKTVTWHYSYELIVDSSSINSISWGNEQELIIGTSKGLSLLHVNRRDQYSKYIVRIIWSQCLATPCYLVGFSKNSELIACVSKYDKFVKFFYRTNFDIDNTQFSLLYLKHSSFVTDLKFRFIDQSKNNDAKSSNYNILYTISSDNFVRVFLSFEFQKSKKVQHWGSLKLTDSLLLGDNGINQSQKSKKFIKIIDNYFFDYLISRSLERLKKHNQKDPNLMNNLQKLIQLESDLIMVADVEGNLSFYLVANLNSNPPKSILFKKLSFNDISKDTLSPSAKSSISTYSQNNKNSINFPHGIFPENPHMLTFTDSIKIHRRHHGKSESVSFAKYEQYNNAELSNTGDIAFIIHDFMKKNLRFVYFRLDNFLQNINYNKLYCDYDELYTNNLNRSITNLSYAKKPDYITGNKSSSMVIEKNMKGFHYLNAVLGNKFTGHNKSIQRLFKDLSGQATLSISRFNEHKLWTPLKLSNNGKITLQRKCTILTVGEKIVDAILLRSGETILTYSLDHKITIWTTQGLKIAKQVGELDCLPNSNEDKMDLLSFFHVPEHYNDYKHSVHYIIAIYKNESKGGYSTKSWELDLDKMELKIFEIDELIIDEEISCISPVDPVGWKVSLDNYSRDILTIIYNSGLLMSYSVRIDKTMRHISWIRNCAIETNIVSASHIKGSSINKIAIADKMRTKLYVYNTTYPLLEYSQEFDHPISDLDWANMSTSEVGLVSNTGNIACLLSVGFCHSVLLYSQLNFDYTNNLPAFAPIKKIDLERYNPHFINDSTWLNNGLLVIGIGNQLFVNDNFSKNSLTSEMIQQDPHTKKIIGDRSLNSNSIDSIFKLVELLNNTLPIYHPQNIIQCIYFGKINLVKKIFLKLYLYLKNINLDEYEDHIRDFSDNESENEDQESYMTSRSKIFKVKNLPRQLDISTEEFFSDSSSQSVSVSEFSSAIPSMNVSNLSLADTELYHIDNFQAWVVSLKEIMMKISLPVLTRHQQITLLTVIESLEIIEKYKLLTKRDSSMNSNVSSSNMGVGHFNSKSLPARDDDIGSKLDLNGINFLLGFKLYQSHFKTQSSLNMRDNLFGIYCKNKGILLDIINGNISVDNASSSNQESKMNWSKCKKMGMVYWLNDDLLTKQFEIIANNEFQNSAPGFVQSSFKKSTVEEIKYFETSDMRSPINSTLFYLSLRKKSILIKLWKISHGHPEQQKLIKFLSLDFEKSEKNKLSAVKNAFALLSKHRYYLASCFFLLGGKLQDCINVLIKKCNDMELAIAVARVYESSSKKSVISYTKMGNGPVFTKILIDHLLPIALEESDRCLNTYIYHSLNEQRLSLLALIRSPYEVLCDLDNFLEDLSLQSPLGIALKNYNSEREKQKIVRLKHEEALALKNHDNNLFLKIDPILVVIYKEFRDEILKKRAMEVGRKLDQGAVDKIDNKEFEFIYRISLIYSRMGCDCLSIDLLRNWTFTNERCKQVLSKYGMKSQDKNSNVGMSLFKKSFTPTNNVVEEFNFDSFGASGEVGSKVKNPPEQAFQEFDMGSFGI
ncbi:Rav1 protein [Saccharomycopsis crataegensis]|uniref:Rav1 protein n=1 Tax=Saccharomycopsis crataegensis TaxID=43959 RepID=A0AAV5QI40_9ASCO|nr:Rav1 protein [Saccharomycopsis crataegensis]